MVYIIQRGNTDEYKVGTSNNPTRRMKDLQTGNGKKLKIVKQYIGERALERKIHDKLRANINGRQVSMKGEWFLISPEWFFVICFEIKHRLLNNVDEELL